MFKWKRLFLVIIIILLIIIVQARNINVDGPFRGLLGNIVNPVIFLTNKVFSGIGGVWNSYINLVNVQKENQEYKKIIDNLTLENTLLSEKLSQSERLQTLLRLYRTYDFQQMPANVVGVSDGYVKNIELRRTKYGTHLHRKKRHYVSRLGAPQADQLPHRQVWQNAP